MQTLEDSVKFVGSCIIVVGAILFWLIILSISFTVDKIRD